MRALERLFRAAERRPWSVTLALGAPVWIALVRMLLERYLSLGDAPLGRPPFPWFAHIVTFYLALLVTLSALLVVLAKLGWQAAMRQVGMGLTLGTLPPLIDVLVYGRGRFAYEYRPGFTQLPWLLHEPPRVLPAGETTVLWLTIALMTYATWRATKQPGRALLTAASTWLLVLLFLVWLPGAAHALSRLTGLAPSEWRNALFGLVTVAGVVTCLGLWRRLATRLPHVLLPGLFVGLGAVERGPLDGPALLAALQVLLLAIGFTLANDWYDRKEDEAGGRTTSLTADGAQWLAVVPLVFAAHVLAFRLELGLALVGFAIVSHAYHSDALRLKCVFPLSYKTEGFLGGLCFLAGLAAAPERAPTERALWLLLLVTLGTPIALVFKDWKDVDADARAGVRTAFVVGEAHGWARQSLVRVAALGLGLSLVLVTGWTARVTAASTASLAALALLALGSPAVLLAVKAPARATQLAMLGAEATLLASVLLRATA